MRAPAIKAVSRWSASVVAAVLVGAQLAPLGLPALAELSHGLHHISEEGGLDFLLDPHTHREEPPYAATGVREIEPTRSHGHTRTVDLLLRSAGVEMRVDLAPPPPPLGMVDVHLPGTVAAPPLPTIATRDEHGSPVGFDPQVKPLPELPPPRA